MANTISALKRHRQSVVRRKQGHSVKSALRSQMRNVLDAVEKKDATASQKELAHFFQPYSPKKKPLTARELRSHIRSPTRSTSPQSTPQIAQTP